MAAETIIALFITTLATVATFPYPANTEVITQPKPGQEYVFVQSSSIQRKDKARSNDDFETAHKFPSSLIVGGESRITEKIKKSAKLQKRAADPADAPAPAPAGAIKLDVKKLLERYKTELKTSSTTTPTTSKRTPSRRIKKDADINTKQSVQVTSPRTPLTTGAPISKRDLDDEEDIRLLGAGSEKQRSRIQIKKGPNGQEYEYEYVYYYYDDDDEVDNRKPQKVSNSHDGPIRGNNRSPESNEVVPASPNGKSRGRQLGEDIIAEDRLPANTRFPPRSRDLNTTPKSDEEDNEGANSRTRGRGRQPTESESPSDEADNVSDETQSQRDRTRANVRRPSLDLVDNESFNTHTNAVGVSNGPSFPSELPAGPVRFLGATPNEREEAKQEASDISSKDNAEPEEATTETTGMNKVAFDLYAILQGTQKLSGEEDINSDDSDTGVETETTTLIPPTEENFEASSTTTVATTTTTVTTTTTTTTTTEPPTTKTTTTAAPQELPGGRRFRGRGRKTTAATSTTTESPKATAKGGKFGRPRFGRPKQSQSTKGTDSHVTEQSVPKQESKPSSHSGTTSGRGRFGASRTRSRTTAAPSEDSPQQDESHSASTPASRPSLRPRPSFNIRTRTRTTPSPSVSEASTVEETESSQHPSSTTARSRRIQSHGAVRPLRPGPRINLARGRPGVQSTTPVTTEETIPEDDHITGDDDSADEPDEAVKATTVSTVDNSPLGRLKNRNRLNIVANRPKPAASVPVQVRRINPLIARKRPGQSEETPSSEAPVEVSTELNADDVPSTETAEPSKSTTEEPKGLNRLLAGRRRLIGRPHLTTN